MEVALRESNNRPKWLYSAQFDGFFIVGLVTIAGLIGAIVSRNPALFVPVLFFDLWFLGYHHVISTYTRLCFDRKSFIEHRSSLLILPIPVIALTGAAFLFVGMWSIVSVYFYWQWFHYTRQSWGVSRAYRGKDRAGLFEDRSLDQAIFYALPVLGILYRSHQDPGTFLGMELRVFPVPEFVVQIAAAATAGLLLVWLLRRAQAYREGRLAILHTGYMLSHFFIFYLGYVAIDDISVGWLVINMWHNAQYILFVWLFNTRRYSDGVNPEARLISYLSQPGRLWLYLSTCMLITAVVYLGVLRTIDGLLFAGLSATIVLYQIVNFHHYVVDSRIWKVRKPGIRQTLGLES